MALTDCANGPQGTNPSGTVSITVNTVNDAPVLDAAASPSLAMVKENGGSPFGPMGTLVSDLIDFADASGHDSVTDVDDGALTGMAITGADESNGTWWYTTNDGFAGKPPQECLQNCAPRESLCKTPRFAGDAAETGGGTHGWPVSSDPSV